MLAIARTSAWQGPDQQTEAWRSMRYGCTAQLALPAWLNQLPRRRKVGELSSPAPEAAHTEVWCSACGGGFKRETALCCSWRAVWIDASVPCRGM